MALDAAVQEVLQAGLFQDAELGGGCRAAQGPTDPHRGRLQRAADPGGAREPVPRPLGPQRPQGALPRVGRLHDRALRPERHGLRPPPHRRRGHAGRGGRLLPRRERRPLRASRGGGGEPAPSRAVHVRPVEAMRQRSEDATRHAMHALAADTGGFLSESSNNLRAGLREMLKDTETYYVLAYEPDEHEARRRLPPDRGAPARTAGPRGADAVRLLRPRRPPPGRDGGRRRGRGPPGRAAPGGDAHGPRLARPADGDPRPALGGLREPRRRRHPGRGERQRGRRGAAVRPPPRPPAGDGRGGGPRPRRGGGGGGDPPDGAVRDGPLRRGLRAAAPGRPAVPEGGLPEARPLPGAPRRARGRHGDAGERVAEDRGAGPRLRSPDAQQPVPPEGRPGPRARRRRRRTRPPSAASRAGPASPARRASTCSSTPTTRSGTSPERSTSSRRRRC